MVFLLDSDTSLLAALSILNPLCFAVFKNLGFTLVYFQTPPLAGLELTAPTTNGKVKYMVIYISSSVSNFIALNVTLLPQTLKRGFQAWQNLPPTLIGKV